MIPRRRWTLEDIPWGSLRRDLVADSEVLYYMVTTASLIESTTHLYARNLVEHFAADDEIAEWLADGWEPEELQHGRALREYVRRAWPEFDWEAAYAAFLQEFTALCQVEALLPLRSLELVSRCVVEMGTASYYTALSRVSDDPVLSAVAHHIFEDEVAHYKHFYRYFLRHRAIDHVSRTQVLGALWHRLKMMEDEDTYIALKCACAQRYPGRSYDRGVYQAEIRQIRSVASRYFPHEMSVKMLLKPLDMAPVAQRAAQVVMETLARRVLI